MENETKLNEEVEKQEPSNSQYIDAIAKMKENSVSKKQYEELAAENKKLLEAMMDGKTIEAPAAEEKGASIADLRQKLFSGESEMNDLESWETALELREKIMDEGGLDPFLPNNDKVTADDLEGVEQVVAAVKDAIEAANGSPEVFKAKLMSVTRDNQLLSASSRKRR